MQINFNEQLNIDARFIKNVNQILNSSYLKSLVAKIVNRSNRLNELNRLNS